MNTRRNLETFAPFAFGAAERVEFIVITDEMLM